MLEHLEKDHTKELDDYMGWDVCLSIKEVCLAITATFPHLMQHMSWSIEWHETESGEEVLALLMAGYLVYKEPDKDTLTIEALVTFPGDRFTPPHEESLFHCEIEIRKLPFFLIHEYVDTAINNTLEAEDNAGLVELSEKLREHDRKQQSLAIVLNLGTEEKPRYQLASGHHRLRAMLNTYQEGDPIPYVTVEVQNDYGPSKTKRILLSSLIHMDNL